MPRAPARRTSVDSPSVYTSPLWGQVDSTWPASGRGIFWAVLTHPPDLARWRAHHRGPVIATRRKRGTTCGERTLADGDTRYDRTVGSERGNCLDDGVAEVRAPVHGDARKRNVGEHHEGGAEHEIVQLHTREDRDRIAQPASVPTIACLPTCAFWPRLQFTPTTAPTSTWQKCQTDVNWPMRAPASTTAPGGV